MAENVVSPAFVVFMLKNEFLHIAEGVFNQCDRFKNANICSHVEEQDYVEFSCYMARS